MVASPSEIRTSNPPRAPQHLPCHRRGRATSWLGGQAKTSTGSRRSHQEAGEDHPNGEGALHHDVFGDGVGHMSAEDEKGHEVEERSPDNRIAGRKDSRRHDRGNRVGTSWNPLVKSKASATRMTMIAPISTIDGSSGLLDDDRGDDVGHVLDTVEHRLNDSMMSFHRITSISPISPEKSLATALR